MWGLKLLLMGSTVLAMDAQEAEQERQWLTWAEVLGGAPPRPIEPPKVELQSLNSISSSNDKDYTQNSDNDNADYNYDYLDYDEEFFNNNDYIYVDTEDENYVPPEVDEPSEVPQSADRRTLDFFYHLFNDQFRNENSNEVRPSRDATKPRRPSLIEAVFQTIDNHIVEDLREWSTYTAQRDAQAANTVPKSIAGEPAVIQQVSPDNDIVLVTDEQGDQHVVTIDDIVTSLSHLDERTLTNLLLSPPSNDRSDVQFNVSPNLVTAETQNVPVVLGTQKIGQAAGQRPARHTGPTNAAQEEGEEVYVVQDENGQVQIVTLDNIISSLAQLDEESLSSLLLEEDIIPAVVPTVSANSIPSSNSKPPVAPVFVQAPVPKATDIPVVVIPVTTPAPSTDNLSSEVSEELSQVNGESQEEDSSEKSESVVVDGSLVETDDNGDIHITLDPSKPFSLDINNIIALAEKVESQNTQVVTETTDISEEEEPEKEIERGHEILSFLSGFDNFYPAGILPEPIQNTDSNIEIATQNSEDPAGVDAFRSSLLQALGQPRQQQQTAPQPVVEPLIQRLVQPVVQPIVQPIVRAVSQPSSQSTSGIGATLSNLISSLVGETTPEVEVVSEEVTPQQEYVNIVVRQQAANSADTHFGEVSIPLPQPIHFQPTARQLVAAPEISPRGDIPPTLRGLSPGVQRSLEFQANDVPVFIPPGARAIPQVSNPTNIASSRSDSGSIIRLDNKIENQRINPTNKRNVIHISKLRPLLQEAARRRKTSQTVINKATPTVKSSRPIIKAIPISRERSRRPSPSVAPPVEQEPSTFVPSVLQGLPPAVLATLRKQVNIEELAPPAQEDEESIEIENSEPIPTDRHDRSSYATVPEYPASHGGYGYDEYDDGKKEKSGNPWLDIYLLADLTKVHKVGDTNLSVKHPIIGDPSYFVKTRGHGYHR